MIDPDVEFASRRRPCQDRARTGQEPFFRTFRAEPRFDRAAVEHDVLLTKPQRLAGGHPELPFDEVKPCHHLGDGVLDLKPRVHFHEIEAVVLVEQEFDGAGADIVDRSRRRDRRFGHARAQVDIDGGRRRLFDDLLMPPLDRTVALAQMHDGAVAIGEHLHFDVARPHQRALQQKLAGTKGGERLRPRRDQRASQRLRRRGHPHSASAAARGGLHHDRIADRIGCLEESRVLDIGAAKAGN